MIVLVGVPNLGTNKDVIISYLNEYSELDWRVCARIIITNFTKFYKHVDKIKKMTKNK